MKVESDIRQEIYDFLTHSGFMDGIKGTLFKYEEERPEKQRGEDVVIVPLSEAPFSDVQEAEVLIRIYVADLYDEKGKLWRADGIRIREFEERCRKSFRLFHTKGSRCTLVSVRTFKAEASTEHCVVSRINYKYCNY